ncbi:MAG TPA: hypothetical protein VF335_05360 [Chitinivibrionales bacterium]
MKKSRAKTPKDNELHLTWSPQAPGAGSVRDKPVSGLPRLEEYFDFLEDTAPVQPDDRPVKLYTERFTL